MIFKRFEDLWNYSEEISLRESLTSEEALEKVLLSLRDKKIGDGLYFLSIISKSENVNIFAELRKSIEDHIVAQHPEDD